MSADVDNMREEQEHCTTAALAAERAYRVVKYDWYRREHEILGALRALREDGTQRMPRITTLLDALPEEEADPPWPQDPV